MVRETFVEKGTDYPLRNGKLSVYETNVACRDIHFYFDQYVLTLMLSGHKTIMSENLKFEFFPGTFFIPEKDVVNNISIPNASYYNPTKCLVLELNPSFIRSVYEEVRTSRADGEILYKESLESTHPYFLSNDQLLIQAFIKLYDTQSKDESLVKEMVEELIIREMLYRLFCTEGLDLLKRNFEKSVEDERIYQVIKFIRANIDQKITTSNLAQVAGLGQTTFFKVFKHATGKSPIDFVMMERIRQARILIQKDKLRLQEIAFKCGFNSYEYFCSSFKKLEGVKPSELKKQIHHSMAT